MNRNAIALVVLLAMLWQSAWAGSASFSVNGPANLEHAALHWQGVSHHHDDDGTVQLDESKESAQHLATDHLTASLAVAARLSHDFSPAGSAAPMAGQGLAAPNPPADGLLRPPRSQA